MIGMLIDPLDEIQIEILEVFNQKHSDAAKSWATIRLGLLDRRLEIDADELTEALDDLIDRGMLRSKFDATIGPGYTLIRPS